MYRRGVQQYYVISVNKTLLAKKGKKKSNKHLTLVDSLKMETCDPVMSVYRDGFIIGTAPTDLYLLEALLLEL